jgi:hypothetical protein
MAEVGKRQILFVFANRCEKPGEPAGRKPLAGEIRPVWLRRQIGWEQYERSAKPRGDDQKRAVAASAATETPAVKKTMDADPMMGFATFDRRIERGETPVGTDANDE